MILSGLEANKTHFGTHFFVNKQRQTGRFRYIVLLYYDVGDFQKLPDAHVHKTHNREFHNLAPTHKSGLYPQGVFNEDINYQHLLFVNNIRKAVSNQKDNVHTKKNTGIVLYPCYGFRA